MLDTSGGISTPGCEDQPHPHLLPGHFAMAASTPSIHDFSMAAQSALDAAVDVKLAQRAAGPDVATIVESIEVDGEVAESVSSKETIVVSLIRKWHNIRTLEDRVVWEDIIDAHVDYGRSNAVNYAPAWVNKLTLGMQNLDYQRRLGMESR